MYSNGYSHSQDYSAITNMSTTILIIIVITASGIGGQCGGDDIDDQSGYSVSLSHDGNTVAIGAIKHGDDTKGHVRVYKYNGTTAWDKIGDIAGDAAGDESGYSVSKC